MGFFKHVGDWWFSADEAATSDSVVTPQSKKNAHYKKHKNTQWVDLKGATGLLFLRPDSEVMYYKKPVSESSYELLETGYFDPGRDVVNASWCVDWDFAWFDSSKLSALPESFIRYIDRHLIQHHMELDQERLLESWNGWLYVRTVYLMSGGDKAVFVYPTRDHNPPKDQFYG